MNRKWVLSEIAIAVVPVLAFFTNPDQAGHLRVIKETIALRKPGGASDMMAVLMPVVHYNNYWVLSTTSFGENGATLGYGYLGQIRTTNDIGILYGVPNQ